VFYAQLRAGRHERLLGRAGREPGSERDVLYFVPIVERQVAADYLDLADATLSATVPPRVRAAER
jgi:hypothetical protein